MGISSLGIGSGLDLDSLVRQLVQAERGPRMQVLDKRENETKVQISALGSLRSAMNALREPLDVLSNPDRMQARAATVKNPEADNPFFTMESSRSAARGNYMVEVLELARGTRAQSGAFANAKEEVTSTAGNLNFATDDGKHSFSIEVKAGATLEDIARQVNESKGNFGVSASIINTGGSSPETRLVFTSDKTGAGSELSVTNDNAELDKLSTVATGDTAGMSIRDEDRARDARISIDGIEAYSSTNTFENVIQNSSITVERVMEGQAIRASVDYDTKGVQKAIEDFVKAYNGLIDNINSATKYSPAGEDGESKSGPLIGDGMVRSIQGSVSSIVSGRAGAGDSTINNLFQLGLTFDKDGKLEWSTKGTGDLGTGKQRLTKALEENFDEVSALFAGENGIATRLNSLVTEYAQSGGLLQTRREAVESQQKLIKDERVSFERYLESFEETQRMRFTALDKAIANMQNGANMMFAQLGLGN